MSKASTAVLDSQGCFVAHTVATVEHNKVRLPEICVQKVCYWLAYSVHSCLHRYSENLEKWLTSDFMCLLNQGCV